MWSADALSRLTNLPEYSFQKAQFCWSVLGLFSERRDTTINRWNFARSDGQRSFVRLCRVLPFSPLVAVQGNVFAKDLPGWKWRLFWPYWSVTGISSSLPGSRSVQSQR